MYLSIKEETMGQYRDLSQGIVSVIVETKYGIETAG